MDASWDWNISVENSSWAPFFLDKIPFIKILKTNLEPENHPFEKENHLPNHHCLGVPLMLVFGSVDHSNIESLGSREKLDHVTIIEGLRSQPRRSDDSSVFCN